MKKIIVASKNPVKINAVVKAFQKMFTGIEFVVEGVSVESGVSNQPRSDLETFQGAWNRAENASKKIDADFWVGIEGGVEDNNLEMESFAWIVVKSKEGSFGKSKTGTLFLPPKIVELIKQGKELGEADDIVFGQANSKQKNGAVGILTNNIVDRTEFYIGAIVLALIPFKNKHLYIRLVA